ncbi:hypothetical protein DA075_17185 [Methylobacterium currus]|uniref:Uncharacterized protein n=1 Tax=Methylobacterium currus TaxID=2051553 RepID=A0A2R4WLL3_9HYPH|nr:hypothetical protein [Methylobacterium currus]AWB22437.1 hypothetical protein DA075_17185 [Methylobacterium currus]UHC17908.1 hypothetical protein LRS73_08705 [Methylobacterium currus]
MPTSHVEAWIFGPDIRSSVKGVYRDGEPIGRVRRWRAEDSDDLTGEWFTVERRRSGLYVPREDMHEEFQDALERIA